MLIDSLIVICVFVIVALIYAAIETCIQQMKSGDKDKNPEKSNG